MQELSRCVLCDTSNFKVIYQKGPWQYMRCLNCSLVSLSPQPSAKTMIATYENYLPTEPKEISNWEMMMEPVIRKSADLIESITVFERGSLLDVGCGYGFFLSEMKSRGWKVEGVEVSPTGRQHAKHRLQLFVHSRPLEEIGFAGDLFDVVTLFYVIEHVHNPLQLLTEVGRILKPGGLILVRWPHSTPIVSVLGPLSKRLDLYHTPYHLYDFSPATMSKALGRCGFKNPQTRIGGYTNPENWIGRWAGVAFGQLGETLCSLTKGSFLLPGVSKTTFAFKARSRWA